MKRLATILAVATLLIIGGRPGAQTQSSPTAQQLLAQQDDLDTEIAELQWLLARMKQGDLVWWPDPHVGESMMFVTRQEASNLEAQQILSGRLAAGQAAEGIRRRAKLASIFFAELSKALPDLEKQRDAIHSQYVTANFEESRQRNAAARGDAGGSTASTSAVPGGAMGEVPPFVLNTRKGTPAVTSANAAGPQVAPPVTPVQTQAPGARYPGFAGTWIDGYKIVTVFTQKDNRVHSTADQPWENGPMHTDANGTVTPITSRKATIDMDFTYTLPSGPYRKDNYSGDVTVDETGKAILIEWRNGNNSRRFQK